jgi:hypothetical protein
MSNEKIILLLQRLHEKTLKGLIAWESTELDDVFQYTMPEVSIRISKKRSRQYQDSYDFILTIYNQEGTLIEEIADTDLKDEIIVSGTVYDLMKDIYENARRIALGVDQAIDRILEELKSDEDDIPF